MYVSCCPIGNVSHGSIPLWHLPLLFLVDQCCRSALFVYLIAAIASVVGIALGGHPLGYAPRRAATAPCVVDERGSKIHRRVARCSASYNGVWSSIYVLYLSVHSLCRLVYIQEMETRSNARIGFAPRVVVDVTVQTLKGK